MITRKDQVNLSATEWDNLIDAINKMHGVQAKAPAYRVFVNVHVRAMDMQDLEAMMWNVHTMGASMPGTNFLAWHRRLLVKFEKRLRKIHADIALPYWDTVTDQEIPARLNSSVS